MVGAIQNRSAFIQVYFSESGLNMKNNGFSLLELIVAATIIGVLATIGYSSFSSYSQKAKRGQAQMELQRLYTHMKQFRVTHGQYFSDFRNIGYRPTGELFYRVGFLCGASGALTSPNGYLGPGAPAGQAAQQTSSNPACNFCGPGRDCWEAGSAAALNTTCVFTADTFRACAAAKITSSASPADFWTIDENKTITAVNREF